MLTQAQVYGAGAGLCFGIYDVPLHTLQGTPSAGAAVIIGSMAEGPLQVTSASALRTPIWVAFSDSVSGHMHAQKQHNMKPQCASYLLRPETPSAVRHCNVTLHSSNFLMSKKLL